MKQKVSEVENALNDLCNENEMELIEHLNIDPEKHLNYSKIPLTEAHFSSNTESPASGSYQARDRVCHAEPA